MTAAARGRAADPLLADRLRSILWRDGLTRWALLAGRRLDLPNWRIVSGALYNTVWNQLSGKPSGYGVRDIDLFYFDHGDLSYAAEDAVIRRAETVLGAAPTPVEIRNQARAHLWFPEKFGVAYPPLANVDAALDRFASRTHAVAARLDDAGRIEIVAPFGLEDVFAMRLTPNRALDNQATYERKAARAKALWPELTIEPWRSADHD